jgi:heme exporter protein C
MTALTTRDKVTYTVAVLGTALLIRNLYAMFLVAPDEAAQGAIYRLLYFHVPAWWTAFLAVGVSAVASAMYLVTKNLRYDALAVAVTEVALTFLIMGMVLGSIWGRIIWGIWWTWDARLTSAFICVLLYAGYVMLRGTIEEPSQRARISAVFSLFAFSDVPIVWFSIRWWRTQHPQPMQLPPDMMTLFLLNWLAMMLLAGALSLIRLDQEEMLRKVRALRQKRQAVFGE